MLGFGRPYHVGPDESPKRAGEDRVPPLHRKILGAGCTAPRRPRFRLHFPHRSIDAMLSCESSASHEELRGPPSESIHEPMAAVSSALGDSFPEPCES